MQSKPLIKRFPSLLITFLCGILAGILTRLTDFFRAETLWSFSSVATLFGFWILSVAVIVLLSSSNRSAGIGSFLYMFGMTLSFYALQYVLGRFLPRFHNEGFKTGLFLLYSALSVGCGIGAFVLFYWNKNIKANAVLYAMPVGALLAETIAPAVVLIYRSLFLFQFLLDLSAAVALGILFYKRSKSKPVYFVSLCLITAAVYCVIYRPFLPL